MVKRGREGYIFSKEPGNLKNIHSYKFSGLANAKTIHVTESLSGIQITTRKSGAAHGTVKKALSTANIRPRSGARRAIGIAAASSSKHGYRSDLRTAAIARVSALLAAQKEPRAAPPKKLRGRKAKEAAAAAAAAQE